MIANTITDRTEFPFKDWAEGSYEAESMINLRDLKNKPVGSAGVDINNSEDIAKCGHLAGIDVHRFNTLLCLIEGTLCDIEQTEKKLKDLVWMQRSNYRELKQLLKERRVIK